jgi:hypothetical protein
VSSECGVVADAGGCHPGDKNLCPSLPASYNLYEYCEISNGMWTYDPTLCWTPLVLAFAGERVEFTHVAGYFDLAGTNARVDTDWVAAQTPWLALDRNGNGRIDDGSELFGSMTPLADGSRAHDGFAALSALDDDGDGRITARDSAFGELLVWRDINQDRASSPDELTLAADTGLVSIELGYRVVPRCVDGDCEMERARFKFRDGQGGLQAGDVIDVHLVGRVELPRALGSEE